MFVLRAAKTKVPAGMALSSSFSAAASSSYQQITGFAADTTNYPGSTVSSNALVIPSTATYTLSASASWSSTFSSYAGTLEIERNGTVVVTGSAGVAGSTGTCTATTTLACTAGDLITLWYEYSLYLATTVTAAYVHAT